MADLQDDPASPSDGKGKGPKRMSVLGLSLGRTTAPSSLAGTAKSQASDTLAEDAVEIFDQRPVMLDPTITSKIAHKYGNSVREAEQRRMTNFMPLDQQVLVNPHELDVAMTVKADLDSALQQSGGASGRPDFWDKALTSEPFRKQLEFLNVHSRTGRFIEQYGTDGRYEGDFLYGMRHGKGTHEFRGEVYDGEWKWDQRHGWGTLTTRDGGQIKGNWQNGKPHGFVSIVDAAGKLVYEGEFKNGKRDGLGQQVFENGEVYTGGWKEGKLHDRGKYYWPGGTMYQGMWNEGQYDGVGIFHYANDSWSRRVYKQGLLISVQEYDHSSRNHGKTLSRDGMQKHTTDKDFPHDVFLLTE